MTAPSFEQLVSAMVAMGTERANAERLVRRKLGVPDVEAELATTVITWPARIILPWSHLVSDDRKYGVINGKMLLSAQYRQAKAATRERAMLQLGLGYPLVPPAPVAFPLRLEARVWVPDDTRAHDVPNFAKCVHDALEGVVYVKDRWLWKASWERAGVDVDAPRAEITITPWEIR